MTTITVDPTQLHRAICDMRVADLNPTDIIVNRADLARLRLVNVHGAYITGSRTERINNEDRQICTLFGCDLTPSHVFPEEGTARIVVDVPLKLLQVDQ